jgi:putative methionine-R-sulfoxide reductase with GAF domain
MSKIDKLKRDAITTSLNETKLDWQQLLENIISCFDCTTGTIHFLDEDSSILKLHAHQGIPHFLIPKIEEIPIGKGMAGIAAERMEPVEICNLQTDDSGVSRPAAKETKVEGSIAVPMILNGVLCGTFGVAKPVPYDFTKEEISELLGIGAEICTAIKDK